MFRLTIILSLFITTLTFSQELACTVTVDARQTGNENLQIFKSLQNQLTEFINNTKWSNRNIKNNERIDCSMFINISSYDNDSFQATLQIQSSRPIYNSSYNSPVYNFNDKNFTFRYQEFQNLSFNADVFESNLVLSCFKGVSGLKIHEKNNKIVHSNLISEIPSSPFSL